MNKDVREINSAPLTLPERTRVLFGKSQASPDRNPGLLLDKYTPPAKQEMAGKSLRKIIEATPATDLIDSVLLRRKNFLNAIPRVRQFAAKTAGRLTLHLARAAALENTGICLHPIYGFVYLPASGLKGMAHAYACQCWLTPSAGETPSPQRLAQWNTICRIFGTADSPWLGELASRLKLPATKDAAGSVIFHEAWPTTFPKLLVDLTNNHHTQYYGDGRSAGQSPPNDAESPIPVNFLAIGPDIEFLFAFSPRRSDTTEEDLDLARQWLAGALAELGCGAKTNAGYGFFTLSAPPGYQPQKPAAARTFAVDLKLITPAFLAGAHQASADDCELRPATLRGQLRWWWRTLHAAYLTPQQLALLEAALWGDAHSGSPVSLRLQPVGQKIDAECYEKTEVAKRENLPPPKGDKKTIQGLFYLSYGMDDGKNGKGDRRIGVVAPVGTASEMDDGKNGEEDRRFYLPPGKAWKLHITVRPGRFTPLPQSQSANNRSANGPKAQSPTYIPLSAEDIESQVKAALHLLGTYGGVGARSRKGFGSMQVTLDGAPPPALNDLMELAAALRKKCGLKNSAEENNPELLSSAFLLGQQPLSKTITVHRCSAWQALDALGTAYQAWMRHPPTGAEKAALGLPRATEKKKRYASPLHFHFAPGSKPDEFIVTAVAFPQRIHHLNTHQVGNTLKIFLEQFHISHSPPPAKEHAPRSGLAPSNRGEMNKRPSGTATKVTIIGSRSKCGYDVQEEGKNQGSLTLGNPPPDLKPGDVHEVLVKDDAPKPQYLWPASSKPGNQKSKH